jgi:hypothetical protein
MDGLYRWYRYCLDWCEAVAVAAQYTPFSMDIAQAAHSLKTRPAFNRFFRANSGGNFSALHQQIQAMLISGIKSIH